MNLLLAVLVGLGVSVGVERWLAPQPPGWRRPTGAWCVHIGLWLLAFVGTLILVQRPWFAMLLVSVFLLLIVVISNAKFKSLAEPFTVQDFRYLTDAIRYPRLYLPFLGWVKALVAICGVSLAVGIGLWVEPALPGGLLSISTTLMVLLFGGMGLLVLGDRYLSGVELDPIVDVQHLGLLGSIWGYGCALKSPPQSVNCFDPVIEQSVVLQQRPHLVAIQSESFFDPRQLVNTIRSDVLSGFDQAKEISRAFGSLSVPALGANTVRSEFAFLAGINEAYLGAHKFNPYEAVLKGWQVESFPKILKQLGYRTVCIHPYVAGFYSRNRVFPLLGIDEFIDLSAFEGAERSGHYVSDAAVADKILEVLGSASVPTFVFAITMENHGPLHLETVLPAEVGAYYEQAPSAGFEDLTAYLRHLKNADRMVVRLTDAFDQMHTPVSLCWYGDHVPIMPGVYDRLLQWPRDSDYLIWDNAALRKERVAKLAAPLTIDRLSATWLIGA